IRRLDTKRAEQHPGVRAVLTPEDVTAWSKPFISGVKQPIALWALAVDVTRYVGEPLAVVIAEDRYIAEDAVELIDIDYETIPAITSIDEAISDSATILHPAV